MTFKSEYYISNLTREAWNGTLAIIRNNFSIVCLLFVVVIVAFATRSQVVTGDEVRYHLYSASIWFHSVLAMDLGSWQQMSPSMLGYRMETLPALGDGTVVGHPVFIAALLSPLSAFGGAGLRAGGLGAGLLGLYLLYRLLQKTNSEAAALAAVAVTAFSFPLVTHIHTYWIEVFIFLGVVAGISQLEHAGSSRRSDLLRASQILLIPFIHLRAAVIGAAIFLAFALRVYQRAGLARSVSVLLLAGCFCGLLMATNWMIYGALSGSVTTARPPTPIELFSVLAMQMTDIKGLLPYSPIWALGYAGLIAGAVQGRRPLVESLIFSLVALATSIGVNPGEGWPARFFVASTPMLAVGLAFWFDRPLSWPRATVTAILLALTAVISAVFIRVPNLPLENRQSDIVFQKIYERVGVFNPGLFLPIEPIDFTLSKVLFCGAIAIILFCAWSVSSRRTFPALSALVLILAALEMTRVKAVPASFSVANGTVQVSLPTYPKVAIFEFGKHYERWFGPPKYATIRISTAEGSETRPANQVIALSSEKGISGFTMQSDKMDIPAQVAFRAQVYRPRSVLAKLARRIGAAL